MALQHDSIEPDEARSIVASWVEPAAQRLERRLCDEPLQAAQHAALKLLLQERADEPRDTFHRLQCHVADETVADDDVDVGVKNAVAFDEADIVQAAAGEQLARLADGFIAF